VSTETTIEIRGLARDFARTDLRTGTEHWDAKGAFDDAVVPKLAELGFFGMLVPETSGGMGFDLSTYVAALEEIAWGDASIALLVADSVIAADMLSRFGRGAHDDALGALASGQLLGCLALAETETGTDLTVIETRATKNGDAWTIKGRKRWVLNGDHAGVAVVLARTSDGPAFFAVNRDAFTAGARADTMGLRGIAFVEIELDGAAQYLTAAETDSGATLDPLASLSAAAISVGLAQAALEHAIGYANVREQFGTKLRSFEAIQHKLAEMATRTASARALVAQAAINGADGATASIAKLAAGTGAMFVTDQAVQIYGGYGYMRDYPVEKLMRDAKALEIVHGTNELQRLRIASSLYADN